MNKENVQGREGLLIVVSGFSGAGKGTVMKRLIEKYQSYALSISATTRSPREGEVDGREYFFKSVEEFKEMIDRDELIEYAQYVSNFYGTPKKYVEEQLKIGKNVILEIEIQGALKIKEKFPDAVLMFIVPPSAQVLKERLVGRGTESIDVVNARMARAVEEAEGVEAYDYVVVNDDLETCVEDVNEIILSEQKKVAKNLTLINNIRDELKCFSKGD
ncbi:MAG: guanylate kinase [Thermoflexaceae bacterium]|nr:guanylate kinase [Thermoflexaceae bacterium]